MFETDGKIMVVVAVLAVILIGLYVFLFLMERRIKKMENRQTELEVAQKNAST